ncbi:MAG: metallothionein [Thermoanaerobaculia bacterium]|nr:metallothionein [Thermoanaerobaculia bacterium]
MRECAHPPCSCQGEEAMMFNKDGMFYCSDPCSRQPRGAEQCVCGHEECQQAGAPIEPTET